MNKKLNESRSKAMNGMMGVLIIGVIVSVIVAIVAGNHYAEMRTDELTLEVTGPHFNIKAFLITLFLMVLPHLSVYFSGIAIISYISDTKAILLTQIKKLDTDSRLEEKEKTIKCSKCGKESKEGKFCEFCGEPLK